MIVPKQAPVRPRVHSPFSGEVLLLEDEVRGLLERGVDGAIFITGAPGSGKTTALEHLAFVLGESAGVRFLDMPEDRAQG